MKRSVLLLLTVFLVAGLYHENHAQRLIINLYNGDDNSELLSSIQKLYFSDNDLVVDFKTGSEDSYAMADIRKLYFDPAVSVNEFMPDRNQMVVYPNPAGNTITLQGYPVKEGIFRIYRTDGRMLHYGNIQAGRATIDVSGLQAGLYLLNVEGFTAKFVKE